MTVPFVQCGLVGQCLSPLDTKKQIEFMEEISKKKEQLIKGIKMDVKGRMEGKEKFKLLANSSTLGSSWGFYHV